MATTTYSVTGLEKTFSKKSKAVEAAEANRGDAPVEVTTGTGTVVHTVPPFKSIKMSPRYTRVAELPEGVEVPDGLRVAYVRARKNVALLHDPNAESDEHYVFFDYVKGEMLEDRFRTTREAGQAFKALPAPPKLLPAPTA